MRHAKALAFEETLKAVFDQIDHELEEQYAGRYPLRPTRPQRGETANPESDGLFNVGAAFTAGYGSAHGPGYLIEVRMMALGSVPSSAVEEIEARVAERLRALLPAAFPGRTLHVDRDRHVFKIHGDLSLGLV